MGGENTETIEIDLNGKTLNFTTSYMSAIGANNPDATITIKNGTVTSTGNNAKTWNINDMTFANCNYVIENVTFNKEVALTNAGKSVTMNDVTINGTGDYYALWISAKGQTVKVDKLKINTSGRGIKIDQQYVDAPAKVTLDISNSTFKTAKKAAIMVESVEGAEINVSNININEVATDNVHAVWVDADAAAYADKVVVTGAKKAVEGTVAFVSDTEGLKTAIANGNANIVLAPGTYIIPKDARGKTLTFTGTKDVVVNVNTGAIDSQHTSGSTITFEGVTIQGAPNNYRGFPHTNAVNFKNCTIKDLLFLYSTTTFENCIFESTAEHCVWTYGAGDVTFTNCDFTYSDRCINVYSENNKSHDNVTFTKCKFITSNTNSEGAVEINSKPYTTGVTVNLKDCVAPTYGDMVFISKWDDTGGEKTTVYKDGVKYNTPIHKKN